MKGDQYIFIRVARYLQQAYGLQWWQASEIMHHNDLPVSNEHINRIIDIILTSPNREEYIRTCLENLVLT